MMLRVRPLRFLFTVTLCVLAGVLYGLGPAVLVLLASANRKGS